MTHRFLIVHAKDVPDDALTAIKESIERLLTAFGQPFTLTLARDEWQANFERCGGWSEWIDNVVNGIDFTTSEQRFTGYIANGHILGKASAQILELALAKPKPVVVFDDGRLLPARRVTQVEAHNFKAGWWIE